MPTDPLELAPAPSAGIPADPLEQRFATVADLDVPPRLLERTPVLAGDLIVAGRELAAGFAAGLVPGGPLAHGARDAFRSEVGELRGGVAARQGMTCRRGVTLRGRHGQGNGASLE